MLNECLKMYLNKTTIEYRLKLLQSAGCYGMPIWKRKMKEGFDDILWKNRYWYD